MGGPCFLVNDLGEKQKAPPCTDNFQILTFSLNNDTWYSVEQCYQALKFSNLKFSTSSGLKIDALEMESNFINIRDMIPKDNETDSAFGMRAWKNGQKNRKIRPDWEQVKVEAMFIVNCAKYLYNKDACMELVSTASNGENKIVGGASTWKWPEWNGKIQQKIRDILMSGKNIEEGMLELKKVVSELNGKCIFV